MRRAQAKVRQVLQDPIYKNRLVAKLINCSMHSGKRSIAQKHVYSALSTIGKETGELPVRILLAALENIKPSMEVRPRRIGGAAYQVPAPVRGTRRESLSIRWLIAAANARASAQYKTYSAKLAAEIVDASKGAGGAVSKKQEVERVAEANKAFSHFRW